MQQVRQDIAGRIAEIEKRWAAVYRAAYKARAGQERTTIQQAQGRWNEVKKFAERLIARGNA